MRDRYASLREGLVGAWIPSVSGSGLLLPDLSGNGNNGALTNMGPEDWVSSQYGRALDFDGSNDYVLANCDPKTFGFGAWALSSWIYHKSGTGVFFAVGDTTTTARYVSFLNNGGTLQVNSVGPTQGTVVVQCGAVVSDDWEHVAILMTTSGLKVYRNGINALLTTTSGVNEQKTWASNQLTAVGIAALVRSTIVIGCSAFNGGLSIYNRALSEPEIKLLASRPGIGLRPQRRTMYYAPPTGARRRRILTSMP